MSCSQFHVKSTSRFAMMLAKFCTWCVSKQLLWHSINNRRDSLLRCSLSESMLKSNNILAQLDCRLQSRKRGDTRECKAMGVCNYKRGTFLHSCSRQMCDLVSFYLVLKLPADDVIIRLFPGQSFFREHENKILTLYYRYKKGLKNNSGYVSILYAEN